MATTSLPVAVVAWGVAVMAGMRSLMATKSLPVRRARDAFGPPLSAMPARPGRPPPGPAHPGSGLHNHYPSGDRLFIAVRRSCSAASEPLSEPEAMDRLMFCKQVLKVKGKHRQILPPL